MNQEEYIDSLENLLIFMCQTHKEWQDVLRTLAKEEGNKALYQVPTIQGMSNSVSINQLAKMEFKPPVFGFSDVYAEIRKKIVVDDA